MTAVSGPLLQFFQMLLQAIPAGQEDRAKTETEPMVGQLSKPVAQTERHVSHLEHLKLVSAQMEKTTVMQEK